MSPDQNAGHAPEEVAANPGAATAFGVVVPLKSPSVGKSRLAGLGDAARRELVEALALDTLAAVMACPPVDAVLAVTGDPDLAAAVRDLGVQTVPDPAADLNATLRHGAAELARRRPGLRPVAVCGDLPCLLPEDLAAVLGQAPHGQPAFVADAAGVGTTVYLGPDLARFAPRFGARSRAAHSGQGAIELSEHAAASVRRDVDTPADLHAALLIGAGPRTTAAAGRLGIA